ncbi:hypothetical protein F0U59_26710 [Archangium gephyra]|nr:hypothetical protein F0U59_26710 [Archangium gephyra]
MPEVPGMSSVGRAGLERLRSALPAELDALLSATCQHLHGAEPLQALLGVLLVLGHMRAQVGVMLGEYMSVVQANGPATPITDSQTSALVESWNARGLLSRDALGPLTGSGTLLA